MDKSKRRTTGGTNQEKPSGVKKNSILIVDDARTNRDLLKVLLEPDYTVYTASGGSEAIEIVNEKYPDLILLDIIMPDLSGFDVLRMLKKEKKTKNIPVIIISGLEDTESEERGLDLEAADFIHKPFNVKTVKLKIRNQLQIVNQIRAIERYAEEESLAISKMLELQKELEASIENAQAANKAKSAFLARMSHEIRTPLNAVIGISEMQLQNHILSADAKEAFIRINNSGDLLLGIINDILDISKIEAGKLELTQDQYNVCRMINDTVYLNTIKHEDTPIEFILRVDENVPSHVYGDEIRIRQILNNLLSNAFKYTSAGEVELSINAERAATPAGGDSSFIADKKAGGYETIVLVFCVRDTGQGMTEEQLGKIFDEYSRFNMSINKAIAGTGLGMGITKNLIHMMNGEIKAESKKGSGSLFTVRIPQGNVNAQPIGKETAEKMRQFRSNLRANVRNNQISREPIPFGKVLIVDDIDMNLYVTKGLLSPYGLQIDTAISGFEAIEKIKKSYVKNNLYDLVFMDHIMPAMDGIETTKKIRELGPEYEKLPIIMLTANAFSVMKDTLHDDGFNGFLLKPVNIQELDAILKEWISPKKINKAEDIKQTENTETLNNFFEALAAIKEINIKTGLSHVADKKDTYCETLGIFFGKLKSECGKMSDFLENKDLHNFLISIHSMKTMLAIIGASTLSEMARTMQIASSKHDINYCKHRFVGFRKKMLLLHDKLAYLFPAGSNPSPVSGNEVPYTINPVQHTTAKNNYSVLIVEDTEMILNILKFKFEEYGLQVDTAASGAEAIEKTANNEYDIVFMDYRMPEMDGIEATDCIRKRERETNAKQSIIIALTGDIDPQKEKMFLNNGFNGFLSKPVAKQDLEEILKRYC